jgi:hypothetical protein
MLKIAAPPIACVVVCCVAGAAFASGHTLQNSRLAFLFGSANNGYTTSDADRVDGITWIDSAGKPVANFIAQANPECNDPLEYFGEAYGNGDASRPYAVIHGVASNWSGASATAGTTKITSLTACSLSLDAKTTTEYSLSASPGLVNALKVTRIFTFVAKANGGNLRAYLARVPLATYPMIVYPDSANVVHSVSTTGCGFNCEVTNWNGKWMAEDTGSGQGIAIFRKTADAAPAEITIDYDSDSASNASAITLIQPAAGWAGKVTETEYLCFYDATSWPVAKRAAGTPPIGCTGVPH